MSRKTCRVEIRRGKTCKDRHLEVNGSTCANGTCASRRRIRLLSSKSLVFPTGAIEHRVLHSTHPSPSRQDADHQDRSEMTYPPMIIFHLCSPAQSLAFSNLFILLHLSPSLASITSSIRRSSPVHLDCSYSRAARSAAIDNEGKTINSEPYVLL